VLSYWEKTTLRHFDLVVIGGGIVGLFTALLYSKKHPQHRIAILERGLFPDGASTKNAGFTCFGSISELENDLQNIGRSGAASLVMNRYRGLQLLREELGDKPIQYEEVGGYEVCFDSPSLNRIEFFNDLVEPFLGQRPYSVVARDGFGFTTKVHALIKNKLEGTVNTGKMIAALQDKVSRAGVITYTQSDVLQIDDYHEGKKVLVQTLDGSIELIATQVALCTNAFSRRFLPQADISPGRGMIMISKPHRAFSWKGSFHYHEGYNYFRTIDNRLLIGGGRHLDEKEEATLEHGVNKKIEASLISDLNTLFGAEANIEIDHAWSGIMAFGKNKTPLVQRIDPHLVAGMRLGGMGVAIGANVGDALAELLDS
tara:strand:+ start:72 stop:1184 length:1113 start_codon:yes stop_codon:yes gene_type:complete